LYLIGRDFAFDVNKYNLFETGYRDITAMTASIASKQVFQINEIYAAARTLTAITTSHVELLPKKSNETQEAPFDFNASLRVDFSEVCSRRSNEEAL
jgi:hypothetical protein